MSDGLSGKAPLLALGQQKRHDRRRMMRSRQCGFVLAAILAVVSPTTQCFAQRPHNVILFVADGLRPGMVNEQTTPALAGLIKKGVHFPQSASWGRR
jgi:membrane-anchored protein YejM (alkaline phosphatase superfamily)